MEKDFTHFPQPEHHACLCCTGTYDKSAELSIGYAWNEFSTKKQCFSSFLETAAVGTRSTTTIKIYLLILQVVTESQKWDRLGD